MSRVWKGGVTAGRRSVANVRALYRHGPSMNVQALVGSGKPSQSKGAIAQARTKVRPTLDPLASRCPGNLSLDLQALS